MNSKSINEPLVSVIVMTYNQAAMVTDTLESVKNQTYDNIELIITDDYSTDNTLNTCREWLDIHGSRFIHTTLVTTHQNTGRPGNCNRGLASSNGEWIKIIAADDGLEPNCIQDNLEHIAAHVGIRVLFSYMKVYQDSLDSHNFIEKFPAQPPIDFINDEIDSQQQFKMLLIQDRVGYTASAFIHKQTIVNLGGWDSRYFLEDYPMWVKLTKAGNKLHFMEKSTVKYRKHGAALTLSGVEHLINPIFIRLEKFRRENTYPYMPLHHRLDYWYKYHLSVFLRFLFNNKSSWLSRFILNFAMKWTNPLYYYRSLLRITHLFNKKH